MIYLVYRMKLSAKSRQDMKTFWAWLEDRERFFYDDLPMVKEVKWFYSVIGDVYVIENWAAFEDEAGWGEYRATLGRLKSDDTWESERVTQDDWWDFLDTRIVTNPPVEIGFSRRD